VRRLHDIPAFGAPVELVWRQRRYRCAELACSVGGFSEDHPLAPAQVKLTSRPAWWAIGSIQRDNASVASVARRLGVDWHTVWDAMAPLLAELADDPGRTRGTPRCDPSGAPRRPPAQTSRPATRWFPGRAPAPGRRARVPQPAPLESVAAGSTKAPSTASTESERASNEVAGTASCSARAPGLPRVGRPPAGCGRRAGGPSGSGDGCRRRAGCHL
jgi:hypothetical protein